MESLDLLADGQRQNIMAERVLKDDIEDGIDELGVLLLSDHHPSLWLGSQLSIDQARSIAPHNNATSLQVVGSMMAAIEWIALNPRAGRRVRSARPRLRAGPCPALLGTHRP
jgi:homospermidine synthase